MDDKDNPLDELVKVSESSAWSAWGIAGVFAIVVYAPIAIKKAWRGIVRIVKNIKIKWKYYH